MMYRKKLELLGDFISSAEKLNNSAALDKLISEYTEKLGDLDDDPELSILAIKLFRLSQRLIDLRSDNETVRRISELTLEERIELEQVERIIEGNLLCYHFQPIVSAVDGSIYSYEALMRPIGSPLISPFHILKYAALTERLQDIERATFLNVLTLIDTEPERFFGKMVFINSIPNIVLPPEDTELIGELLVRNADKAVIEMTEGAELDERKFDFLKEKYRTLNIRIAIDDYGTGYSNIKSLLSYLPNYVKIDRSLLSEIQNSQKKRHFVRDIIEFCHDNGILALAEGVETSEELREVILLGIDLIQGYYTAKPSPDVRETIDDDIISEIVRFRTELREGVASKQYVPENGETILLDKLSRDNYSSVLIGKGLPEGASLKACGSLGHKNNMRIKFARGFKGELEIEQVHLQSIRLAPCIELEDYCDVKLIIAGENNLNGAGIRVPEHSRLEMVGNGALIIKIDSSEYYGIGNDLASKNGELVFAHNSMIHIEANGQGGVGIGSGLGGKITICSGMYRIAQQGSYGVGIGSFNEPASLEIHDCDLETDISTAKGVGIGSLYSCADVRLYRSSFRSFAGGIDFAAIGTADKGDSKVYIDNANISMDIRADKLTAVGSLMGSSDISISKASFRASVGGNTALAFGGADQPTKIRITNADVGIDLSTELDVYTCAKPEDIVFEGGRSVITVNGKTAQ